MSEFKIDNTMRLKGNLAIAKLGSRIESFKKELKQKQMEKLKKETRLTINKNIKDKGNREEKLDNIKEKNLTKLGINIDEQYKQLKERGKEDKEIRKEIFKNAKAKGVDQEIIGKEYLKLLKNKKTSQKNIDEEIIKQAKFKTESAKKYDKKTNIELDTAKIKKKIAEISGDDYLEASKINKNTAKNKFEKSDIDKQTSMHYANVHNVPLPKRIYLPNTDNTPKLNTFVKQKMTPEEEKKANELNKALNNKAKGKMTIKDMEILKKEKEEKAKKSANTNKYNKTKIKNKFKPKSKKTKNNIMVKSMKLIK